MNTREIYESLQYLPLSTFGVYPADQIPRVWTLPAGLVVNTDKGDGPGEHWVAMYVDDKRKGVYFDSYGLPPIIPQHLARLRRNCKFYRYNLKQLQSNTSDVCGQFCVVFLHLMSSGFTMSRFNSLFSDNLKENDNIVREYYNTFAARRAASNNNKFNGGGISERRLPCLQGCCIRR